MSATSTVLLYSCVAAAAAGLGALPFLARDRLPRAFLGWANALAAGMMLGSAYLLTAHERLGSPLLSAAGALLGIAFTAWSHTALGAQDLDLDRVRGADEAYGRQVFALHALHSASEGVAIGAAMALGIPFGIFMALATAVHNVPEGAVLAAVLRGRGVSVAGASGLAVGANLSQVLLALATHAAIGAAPRCLPAFVGFAAGALVLLVVTEPLPEAYRQSGAISIAVVASLALSLVVLLRGLVL